MKIAILTSGILPVPAVNGGAVENLIDFNLEYNELHQEHDITVYSIYDKKVDKHPALQSHVNHFHFIKTNSPSAKIHKYLYHLLNKKDEYYHYTIEYFFHEAIKDLCRKQFDAIILENRPGYVVKLKKKTKAKLIVHQGNDFLNNQVPHYQEIYDNVTRIINTSSYITTRVRTINNNCKKCITVLNGIDTNKFYNAIPTPRSQLNLNKDDFVIVYSGRLNKEKGILELMQSFVQLKSKLPIKLLIIGASFYGKDKSSTPFMEKLRKIAQSVLDSVIFTGFIEYNLIPSYLKTANIAVVPSMWEEPFGLTVVEAMAAGLPLITTRSGGIPEICEGVATIVNRDNIVDNLTAAIFDLYIHPEKRKIMSQAALERSKYFSKERYAKDFFDAIVDIK